MISIEQINGEIAVLEEEHPTHVVMQKLAALYTVRDHIGIGQTPTLPYEIPNTENESEFMQQVRRTDTMKIWSTMDELMSTLSMLNPRLYEATMRELRW